MPDTAALTAPGRCPSCFELMDPDLPVCDVCSYPDCQPFSEAIAPGTVLRDRYVLGFGRREGNALRYYAWDTVSVRRVRIVEYFANGCVRGGQDGAYLLGLPYGGVDAFLRDAGGDPLETFRANGTAYLVYFDPEVYSKKDLALRRPSHIAALHCPSCLSPKSPGSVCGFCGGGSGLPGGLPQWAVLAGKYMVGSLLAHEGDANLYPALTLPDGKPALVREYAPRYVRRGGDGCSMEIDPWYAGTDVFSEGAKEFTKRAAAVSALSGPGLPGPAELFWENGTVYAVTPFSIAVPLRRYLTARGPRGPREALELLRDVFEAVSRLDGAGLFHTDLSPEAIAVADTGASVLISPAAGYVPGSAADDDGPVLPRPYSDPVLFSTGPCAGSDVYSMAVLYLTVRTGRLFDGFGGPAGAPARFLDRLGPEEATVIARAMSREVSERPRSVTELFELLDACPYTGRQ